MIFIAINLQYLLSVQRHLDDGNIRCEKNFRLLFQLSRGIKNCLWSFNFIYNFHSWHLFCPILYTEEIFLIRRWKAKHEARGLHDNCCTSPTTTMEMGRKSGTEFKSARNLKHLSSFHHRQIGKSKENGEKTSSRRHVRVGKSFTLTHKNLIRIYRA